MQLRWVSAAEGQIFADFITELTGVIRDLGPFDPDAYPVALPALERALTAPKLRWLTGTGRHVTERDNVYHERIDPSRYAEFFKACAEEEYQRALIYEVLAKGPKTVREMSAETGLPIYCVSLRLNDLERTGLADLKSYDGHSPRFMLTA